MDDPIWVSAPVSDFLLRNLDEVDEICVQIKDLNGEVLENSGALKVRVHRMSFNQDFLTFIKLLCEYNKL